MLILVFPRTYCSVWYIVTVNKCLLHACLSPPSSACICGNLGADLLSMYYCNSFNLASGFHQYPVPQLKSLFLLYLCTVYSSWSGCHDYLETEVRSCHCSAQNLPEMPHLTQMPHLTLIQAWVVDSDPCPASCNSVPTWSSPLTLLQPQQPLTLPPSHPSRIHCACCASPPPHGCLASFRSQLRHELIRKSCPPSRLLNSSFSSPFRHPYTLVPALLFCIAFHH